MSRDTATGVRNRTLHFRLATEHRWLTCHTNSAHTRLVDLLNSTQDQMVLVQVESCEGKNGEGVLAGAPSEYVAGVSTGAILCGIPIEPAGAAAAPRRSPAWVERSLWRARIGIGPYEIVGNLHLPKGATLNEEAAMASARFLVVTDATIWRPDGSSVQERVVVVNRARMDFMISEPRAGEGSASGEKVLAAVS